jgi:hypothetical protein
MKWVAKTCPICSHRFELRELSLFLTRWGGRKDATCPQCQTTLRLTPEPYRALVILVILLWGSAVAIVVNRGSILPGLSTVLGVGVIIAIAKLRLAEAAKRTGGSVH